MNINETVNKFASGGFGDRPHQSESKINNEADVGKPFVITPSKRNDDHMESERSPQVDNNRK